MKRDNPKYLPWHCFTVCECENCGELYEAGREHDTVYDRRTDDGT